MKMDYAFTEEHEELRGTVRKFLEDKSHEQAVRRTMESERGYDEDVWRQMAEQIGLQGMIIPEKYGGIGFSHVELGLVMEEMGRVLLCAPYLSSAVLAASTLLDAGDEKTKSELLPAIASGSTIVAVAIAGEHGRWDLGDVGVVASGSGDTWKLSGVTTYVLDGHVAHEILVVGRTGDGLSLFRVGGEAGGLKRRLLPTLDLTRKLARLELKDTPALRAGIGGDLKPALEKVLAKTIAALACEQVGGAQRCLDLSTEYAKTRLQFGRPIGSFQAIKHRCADMLVEVEFARSAAYHAAFRAAEGGDEELLTAAEIAKSYCSDAYFRAAADTIQIHGGMGFTWEHPAHLYFKRAKSSALLFGDPVEHRERLAQRIGL